MEHGGPLRHWRSVRALAPLVLVLWLCGAAVRAEESPPLQALELAPGVVAFVQPPEARFNDSNALLIVGEERALLVDAPQSVASAAFVLDSVSRLTDKPIAFIVNTHWHGDHTLGVAAYLEAHQEAEVVAHQTTARDIELRARPALAEDIARYEGAIAAARERLAAGVRRDGSPLDTADRPEALREIEDAELRVRDMKAADFSPPTILVEDRRVLDLGGRAVELHHLPGHTAGDLVVWIPDAGVLATGDLLDDLPFGGHGSPAQARASLAALHGFDFERFVPGHGSVRQGTAHLEIVEALFETVVAHAEQAVVDGKTLEQAQDSLDVESFRPLLAVDETSRRTFDQFVPATFARAYSEAAELHGAQPES